MLPGHERTPSARTAGRHHTHRQEQHEPQTNRHRPTSNQLLPRIRRTRTSNSRNGSYSRQPLLLRQSRKMSPGETVRDYYREQGKLQEQIRIIARLKQNTCFECDHASCNDLKEIIEEIVENP